MKPKKKFTPFSISPNPNSLYLTDSLRSVIHKTRFTIENRQGLTCVLGDIGLGKSTILRFLYSEYSAREDCLSILIPTPNFPTPFSLLKSICEDFEIEPKRSMQAQQRKFQEFLVKQYSEDKNIVLFIDEAQTLNNNQLELIRSMLNFETDTEKLVQIVLSGQLELKEKLNIKKNRPLKSRISTYSILDPLTLEETEEVISHRCKYAEIKNPFSDELVQSIYKKTGGIPRSILKLCALTYEMKNLSGIDEIPTEFVNESLSEVAL